MPQIILILFAAGLVFSATGRASFAETRPNFVVSITDDMGFSEIGCYGREIQTLNIDKLAAGGEVFP